MATPEAWLDRIADSPDEETTLKIIEEALSDEGWEPWIGEAAVTKHQGTGFAKKILKLRKS